MGYSATERVRSCMLEFNGDKSVCSMEKLFWPIDFPSFSLRFCFYMPNYSFVITNFLLIFCGINLFSGSLHLHKKAILFQPPTPVFQCDAIKKPEHHKVHPLLPQALGAEIVCLFWPVWAISEIARILCISHPTDKNYIRNSPGAITLSLP